MYSIPVGATLRRMSQSGSCFVLFLMFYVPFMSRVGISEILYFSIYFEMSRYFMIHTRQIWRKLDKNQQDIFIIFYRYAFRQFLSQFR